jgi:hypothetical protein
MLYLLSVLTASILLKNKCYEVYLLCIQTEDVGGWKIVRSFDSGKRVTCELQSDLVLQPGADVRVSDM